MTSRSPLKSALVALMSANAIGGIADAQSSQAASLQETASYVRSFGDLYVRNQRTLCAGGAIQPATEQDTSPLEFCLIVMEETLSRDPGDQSYIMRLYTDWSIRYPQTILQEIARAAMQDGQEFLSVNDMSGARTMKPLNCQTAFDAGFFFGAQNPTQVLDPNTDAITHQYNAERCFDVENPSTRAGFLSGMSFGRAVSSRG